MTLDQLVDEVTSWGDRHLTEQFADSLDSLLAKWGTRILQGKREITRHMKIQAALKRLQESAERNPK